MYFGTAYGEIKIEHGMYILQDSNSGIDFKIISTNAQVFQNIDNSLNELVKLTFEPTSEMGRKFVIPKQIERVPEEYAKPKINGLLFTYSECERGAIYKEEEQFGISHGYPENSQYIRGFLMRPGRSVANIRSCEEVVLSLNSKDFALIYAKTILEAESFSEINLQERMLSLQGKVIKFFGEFEQDWLLNASSIYSICDMEDWPEKKNRDQRLLMPIQEQNANISKGENQGQAFKRKSISNKLRYEIFKRDKNRCVDCGASPLTDVFVKLEVDHRLPVSKGGTNDVDNLQTLCWACNNGKRDQIDHKLNVSVLSDDLWDIAA